MNGVVKYHAMGNDYLVADPERAGFGVDSAVARILCDRNAGLGADGVLYGPLADPGTPGTYHLRIFNADGTECARSGNGLRLFARYLREHGYTDRDEVVLHTLGGAVRVRHSGGPDGTGTVDLGGWSHHDPQRPADAALIDEPIEVAGVRLRVTTVHNGVPHAVLPVADASAELARELGPLLVEHPAFSDRMNIEFLTVEERNTVRVEVWERGAGHTRASGSGACAAVCAAYRLGLVDAGVTVRMPGGSVGVDIVDGERVLLTGPSREVGTTILADEFRALLQVEPAR
ncbi:diaminopimelate epimerase [Streptomyces spiroverticillatus]|nr:diaminopimelate epimerase [Streptomyces finlayi]